MKRRLLSLLLVIVMVLGMFPVSAGATGADTVYISISRDGNFVKPGDTYLAHVPVKLSDLQTIDLDEYGLSEYLYDADKDGAAEITALHLLIYAHETLYGGDWKNVRFGGSPGSSFIEGGLFGWSDCNLQYRHNGVYPLPHEGTDGLTSDRIVLTGGDYLDIAHFSSWNFYSDANAGFNYFTNDGEITYEYGAAVNEALTVTLCRSVSVMGSRDTYLEARTAENYHDSQSIALPIFYGESLYDDEAKTATIDGQGQATITFDEAGTYYLWADGGYGAVFDDMLGDYAVVSSPAYAKVTVIGNMQPEEPASPVTVTAPIGSTVSVGTLKSYFVYTFAEPVKVEENNVKDVVTYGFDVPSFGGNSFVRVQHPNGVTYWDYVSMSEGTEITIKEDMLFMNDSNHNSDTIIHDLSEYEMDVADVYINANAQGYLPMNVGGTFEFNVFRDWHAVEGISNAKTALPDVSYQVIDIDGNPSDVVTVVPDENNSSVATMTAKKEGTAIVLVTYDAMYSTLALRGGIGTDIPKPAFFSAIWPENTGVLVVSVGADGSSVETNMTLNGHALDAEHDVLYYVGNDGASYTFKPEGDSKVAVARASLTEDSLTYSGFESVDANEDGSFTITGLTAGSHIIEVEQNGKKNYQVICTKQTTVCITDANGVEINDAHPADPGEKVTVQLGDIYNPVNKLSGIYNSNCGIRYTGEDDRTFNGSSGSGFGYYLFASDPEVHKVRVTIPEVWSEDTYSLVVGYFGIGGNGKSAGSHRNVRYATGAQMDSNAPATAGLLCSLPQVDIPVNASDRIPAKKISLNKTSISLSIDGAEQLATTVEPTETTDRVVWTSSNPGVAAVNKDGLVTGISAGEATITATAGDVSAACAVTVSSQQAVNLVLTTVSAYENEVYASTMEFSEIVISGIAPTGTMTGVEVKSEKNVITGKDKTCTIYVAPGDYETITVSLKPLLGSAVQSGVSKLTYAVGENVSNPLSTYNDFTYTTSLPLDWKDGQAVLEVKLILNNKKERDRYTINLVMEEPEPTPETYTVTLPTETTGYTVTAAEGSASPVTKGGSYSFTVAITEGYEAGEDFAVKANDTKLTAVDGVYTIGNITADQDVTVEGVEVIPSYTVTLPTGIGYTVVASGDSTSPVTKGGSYSFAVTIVDGYEAGENFAVKANDTTLSAVAGVYTIENITVDQTVTVEGVEVVPTYTVTLPTETTGYTVTATESSISPVTEGSSYSFTVTIAEGYQKGEDFAVKANGTALISVDDVYTISNITTDQTITVEGVVENQEEQALTWQEVMAKTQALLIDQAEVTAPVVNSQKGEWVVLGLARNGVSNDFLDEYYDNVVAYVRANINSETGRLHTSKSTDNSRVILALSSIDKDVTDVVGFDLLKGLTDTVYVKNQGINGPVWALIALDSGDYEIPVNSDSSRQVTREWLIDYILEKQLSGGGWALAGQVPDDMTPMAIQALAPYYSSNSDVKAAVDKALVVMQTMNATTETYAQMIVALSALGIDCEIDERFVDVMDNMLAFALEDGSFEKGAGSGSNQMSTEQAFYALVAYNRFKNGQTGLYDMTDVVTKEQKYTITIAASENGTVTASAEQAIAGAEITLTVEHDIGYELKTLTVKDASNNTINVTNNKFFMPASNVTVTAEFAKTENPAQDVIDAIEDLNVTKADKATQQKISEVRKAYEVLSAENKSKVTNYSKLEAAIAVFNRLLNTAKSEATAELETIFDALKETDYTEENWKKVQSLRNKALAVVEQAENTDEISTVVKQVKEDLEKIATGSEITVTFRLIGDGKHNNGVTDHEEYVTWIPTTTYKLKPGATMYDVFMEAMADYGLSQRGAANGYVESIKAPSCLGGYWLGEFDNGPNSGWMYTVNGDHPGTGLKTFDLTDGDRIIWHYVDDYIQEERTSSSKYYYRWLEAEDISPEEYLKKQEKENETAVSGSFDDVHESDWFYDDVMFAVENGLFNGTGDNKFSPNASLNRAMLVTVLYRLEGEPKIIGSSVFKDVASGQWYTDAVIWATQNEIVNGYGNGKFGPTDNITREQMATILFRYAQFKKYDTAASNSLSGYIDFGDISVFSLKALKWANAEGLINGRTATTLSPKGTATRAEVAAILHRFVENVVNK